MSEKTLESAPEWENRSVKIISVTQLCWSVSRVLNFVKESGRTVYVTNRNRIIASITPVGGEKMVQPSNNDAPFITEDK